MSQLFPHPTSCTIWTCPSSTSYPPPHNLPMLNHKMTHTFLHCLPVFRSMSQLFPIRSHLHVLPELAPPQPPTPPPPHNLPMLNHKTTHTFLHCLPVCRSMSWLLPHPTSYTISTRPSLTSYPPPPHPPQSSHAQSQNNTLPHCLPISPPMSQLFPHLTPSTTSTCPSLTSYPPLQTPPPPHKFPHKWPNNTHIPSLFSRFSLSLFNALTHSQTSLEETVTNFGNLAENHNDLLVAKMWVAMATVSNVNILRSAYIYI